MMITYRIKGYEYSFAPTCGVFNDFDLEEESDLEEITKQACEDFRDNRDGWEVWKEGDADVELYDEEGKLLFSCGVGLQYEPTYEIWGVK